MSTATNSAILVNTSPLFVTLLAPLLIGEKVTRIQFIGVIIAFIGIVLVTMNGLTISEFLRNELLLGNLAFLASALLISLTIVYGKRYIHIHGALVYTFYSAIGGALALFLYALLSNELLTISKITPIFWLIIIYMGMFVTGFTYALWAYGVKHIGASRATALKLLIPLFATLSSVVLLGEALTAFVITGGIMVVIGLALNQNLGGQKTVNGSPLS
jgi:drug/metabolite transporter (DMT)-like permease